MKQRLISAGTLAALLVLVALPLLFIVLQAIFPHFSAGSLSGALTGVPMLFADPQLLPMLGGTLWVACGVALMSVVIGLPLGVLRGLFNVPLPRLWDLLFLIPFLTPPYIAALSRWSILPFPAACWRAVSGWRSSRAFTAPAPGEPSGILRCRCFPRRWRRGCCWRLPWQLRSLASRRR